MAAVVQSTAVSAASVPTDKLPASARESALTNIEQAIGDLLVFEAALDRSDCAIARAVSARLNISTRKILNQAGAALLGGMDTH